MSSSNLVRIAIIEEATQGVTPAVGDFSTVRFTSESLSGSPETTESAQIRIDRLSSGQIVTSLSVAGELAFELAKEPTIDNLIESAMYSEWGTTAAVTVDLTIDATAKTITRASGDWNGQVVLGDMLILANFTAPGNNTQVMVAEIVSVTVIRVITPEGMVTGAGVATSYKVADKISIGIDNKTFSMEKTFIDLTEKALIYKGQRVDTFNLSVAYGALITGSFGLVGTDYYPVDAEADFITDGRTITSQATTPSLNGSVDMPFIANSAIGPFEESDFCIQSLTMDLNNNNQVRNCIGNINPEGYTEGTAAISISLSSYLADNNWTIVSQKLLQTPFSVGFQLKNSGGWYAFYFPAIQVSLDDPASAGANQDVVLDMSGTAKVGPSGESSVTIYRS